MSVARNLRPERLHNTRYFRRIKERVDAHRVLALVKERKRKIVAGLVGAAVGLVALGAAGALLVRHLVAG